MELLVLLTIAAFFVLGTAPRQALQMLLVGTWLVMILFTVFWVIKAAWSLLTGQM